ncbi:MAG: response regulator transcription factor [Cyclobacteriaceae bacterium]|nr:response regulator transcription factor [Cyclobacteriaceae bacterium]UYN87691.1 MAG: response regulator transcription factor [Cyclobacteriaceae bacterium]
MNLTCLIVEDEPLARNLLVDYVKKVPSLKLVEACSNAMDAMEILRKQQVDLLFLDIQMPEITGITFLKILQKRPLVIFTTAYSQYALEGYELDVVDYLLKPITLERFLKAVDKAMQRHQLAHQSTIPLISQPGPEKPDFVFVKDGTKMVKVQLDDILYVEGMKDYVTIHTREKKITTLQRMKVLEEQLPADKFIRVHHSYIIAFKAIDAVHKSDVQIGQAMIPISDSYKKAFREYVDKNHMQ